MTAGVQIGPTAHRDMPEAAFYGIIVHCQIPVKQEAAVGFLVVQDIVDGPVNQLAELIAGCTDLPEPAHDLFNNATAE
jgi:hypothetical protein